MHIVLLCTYTYTCSTYISVINLQDPMTFCGLKVFVTTQTGTVGKENEVCESSQQPYSMCFIVETSCVQTVKQTIII